MTDGQETTEGPVYARVMMASKNAALRNAV